MKIILGLILILLVFAVGCDTELGHHHEDHDHDGDGIQDHTSEEHLDLEEINSVNGNISLD